MALCELLATDFISWMQSSPDEAPRHVILWLDPEAQFARLLSPLEQILAGQGIQLLQYDPEAGMGQFGLKLTLLRLEAKNKDRAVVYLPGFARKSLDPQADGSQPELWSVYDYRFKGCIWGSGEHWQAGEVPEPRTLLSWLSRHGLVVADSKTERTLLAGGKDSLLARYAEHEKDIPIDRWPRPLRVSDVEDTLAGDAREALRALLSAPNNEVSRWGEDRPLILKQIAGEYGLKPPEGDIDPEGLANEFAIQLALTEAWDSFGRPAGFPFLARLPKTKSEREAAIKFLRDDVLKHTDLGPRFRERVGRLEPKYDLAAWSIGKVGQPGALPGLAKARWNNFLQRFKDVASSNWKEARDVALSEKIAIKDGAEQPWDSVNGDSCWKALADFCTLAESAQEATTKASELKTCADFINAYADGWWQIDWLHLHILGQSTRRPDLRTIRDVTDHAYFEYVAYVNDSLMALIEELQQWPIAGTRHVESLRTELWKLDGVSHAVIVSDALRWDLAKQLAAGCEHQCKLTPILSTLPSETAFGMASLLPLGDTPVSIDFPSGKPQITASPNNSLSSREGRKYFLESHLVNGAGKCLVEFIDLEALLHGAAVPGAPIVVVFDNDIDEQGHKIPDKLPLLAQQLTNDLRSGVDLLHAAGIPRVDIVTDHGFLLLPPEEVASYGSPRVDIAQCYHRSQRWAVLKPGSTTTDVIQFPLPFGSDIGTVGVPRGIRTLEEPQPYEHGGISLQECVIPHLVSQVVIKKEKVGLDLRVSTTLLSTGTVPVTLRPTHAQAQAVLGGFQPLFVRIWIQTSAKEGTPRQVTKPVEQELRPEVEELKLALYLQEGLDLTMGEELELRAEDAETGRDLATIYLRLVINWD